MTNQRPIAFLRYLTLTYTKNVTTPGKAFSRTRDSRVGNQDVTAKAANGW